MAKRTTRQMEQLLLSFAIGCQRIDCSFGRHHRLVREFGGAAKSAVLSVVAAGEKAVA